MPLAIKINAHTGHKVVRCVNCNTKLEKAKFTDGIVVCTTCHFMYPNVVLLSALDIPTCMLTRYDMNKNHGQIFLKRKQREDEMLKFHTDEIDFYDISDYPQLW